MAMLRLTRRLVNEPLARRDGADQLFEQHFVRPLDGLRSVSPALDIYETADEYVVELAVPGFTPEELDLQLEQNRLRISGSANAQADERRYLLRERRQQRFARSVQFPTPVNGEQIQASLNQGILTIRLPKAEEARPRKISVQGL